MGFGGRARSRPCLGRVRFRSVRQARRCAKETGARVVLCELCGGWHVAKWDSGIGWARKEPRSTGRRPRGFP
jgi:hypothetical protein